MNIIKMFAFTLLFFSPIGYAVEVKQITVPQQERGGSCGYHALRNGILIADSINNPSSKEDLASMSLASASDNAESSAYRFVIRSRARKLAAYFIKDYLLQSMQGTLVDKSTPNSYALNLKNSSIQLNKIENAELSAERPFFYNKLINVAHNLAEAQFSDTDAEQQYEITSENLVQAFNEEIKKNDLTYNVSDLDKKINALFTEFKALKFSVLSDAIIKDENNNTVYQANYSSSSLRESSSVVSGAGEWLSSQEINDLLKLERSNPNSFLNKKTKVFILDDALEDQLKEEQDLKELVSNLKKNDFEGIAILIVYYPSHWITCVINKQKNHEPLYLFADSLNIDRLRDKRTLTIIESISGYSENELKKIEVIASNARRVLRAYAKPVIRGEANQAQEIKTIQQTNIRRTLGANDQPFLLKEIEIVAASIRRALEPNKPLFSLKEIEIVTSNTRRVLRTYIKPVIPEEPNEAQEIKTIQANIKRALGANDHLFSLKEVGIAAASVRHALEITKAKSLLEKRIKQIEDNYKRFLPPLGLLVEGGNLLRAQALINQLKQNEHHKKGVLLQGPAGTGKYTLAQKIAHLAGREVISSLSEEAMYVSEIQEIENEDARKEKILEIMFKKASNKNNSILLIEGIEDYPQEGTLRKIYIQTKTRGKTPFYVIATTRDSDLLANDQFIKSFLEPIIISLPSYDQRQNILSFYLRSKSIKIDGEKTDLTVFSSTLKSLATATREYSGEEIKEIITDAVKELLRTDESSLLQVPYNHRLASFYDFKDQKLRSFISILPTFGAFVPAALAATTPSKIESHLWAYQYTHDQRRNNGLNSEPLEEGRISRKAKDIGMRSW